MRLSIEQYLDSLLYRFMLLKVTGKRLFDRNTLYSPTVHRIHGYCYCQLFLLLFTVYTITFTITFTVTVLLLLLLPHHPSILVTQLLII